MGRPRPEARQSRPSAPPPERHQRLGTPATRFLLCLLSVTLTGGHAPAQSERGEIALSAAGQDGRPLAATGTLVSEGRQFRRTFATDSEGHFVVDHLLFGSYALQITAPGCVPQLRQLAIKDALPVLIEVRLIVAPLVQTVVVEPGSTLIDPLVASPSVALGRAQIQQELAPQPGRALLNLIQDQPGWIFEANGVLHPRGSEYDTQFLVNGLPRTENLSPSYATSLPSEFVESAQVLTAGFPAEYGRSLGGVIDVTTGSSRRFGWHGDLDASGGSFSSAQTDARIGYGTARQQFSAVGSGFRTDRFLDPPVLQNFSNRATAGNTSVEESMDLTSADKVDLNFDFASLHSMVPNELVQQASGQRQDRGSRQVSGGVAWRRTLSPDRLLTIAGSVLDSTADLTSNPEATPVDVAQDRGFRQGWLRVDLAGQTRRNEWKVGADAILRRVHEQINYTITDPDTFDPGTAPTLNLALAHWDSEPAAFAEDTLHLGHWNIAAGLRYDNYAFVLHRDAWSPRVAVSRYFPAAHLAVHASYDRVFQVPAIENLLLASSPLLDSASDFVQRLPVEPARANFYEVGFTEDLRGRLRITGNLFLRRFRNYGDDDTLLNTGVSFPIADATARVSGEECTLYMPEWRHVLFQMSYANQSGVAGGPLTGGLFLGDEGADELATTGRFAISQDQRNTIRSHVRWAPYRAFWFGVHVAYNSGLPVELDDPIDFAGLEAAYGQAVLRTVNFARGRVRPWSSIDLAAGVQLLPRSEKDLSLEVHGTNVQDGIHTLNFASLFSGTAIASPPSRRRSSTTHVLTGKLMRIGAWKGSSGRDLAMEDLFLPL